MQFVFWIAKFCNRHLQFWLCLQKVSKRLHLSKSKLAVFSKSGQLVTFYLVSTVWGMDIIVKEKFLPDVSNSKNMFIHSNIYFLNKKFIIMSFRYHFCGVSTRHRCLSWWNCSWLFNWHISFMSSRKFISSVPSEKNI